MDVVVSHGVVICFAIYTLILFSFFNIKTNNNITFVSGLAGLSIAAYVFGLISLMAFPFILALISCSYLHTKFEGVTKKLILGVLAILSLAMAIHKVPGFNNDLLFYSDSFGESNLPYKLYANLDKAIAALALFVAFKNRLKFDISLSDIYLIGSSLVVFFLIAMALGVEIDVKFGQLTIAFIFFNLFVTCFAEEAFFRLIVQNGLSGIFKGRYSYFLTIGITALVFMLAHFHTGEGAEKRLFLIFLAGLIYAAVYAKRKSLGSSILAHFGINIIHFSFFTYPATFSY